MSTWGTRRGVSPRVRERIMLRDRGECQLALVNYCTVIATEIDHIGDSHDDSDDNLRAVCSSCHRARTAQQARAGRAVQAAHRRDRLRRPGARSTDLHPGDR